MVTLKPLVEMVKVAEANNLLLKMDLQVFQKDNKENATAVELRSYELIKNSVKVARLYNDFAINHISFSTKSPYLDCLKGIMVYGKNLIYISTQRHESLFTMMKGFPHFSETKNTIIEAVCAVDHLHDLGFVHRALNPHCFFTSTDPCRPLILAEHQYTSPIS